MKQTGKGWAACLPYVEEKQGLIHLLLMQICPDYIIRHFFLKIAITILTVPLLTISTHAKYGKQRSMSYFRCIGYFFLYLLNDNKDI